MSGYGLAVSLLDEFKLAAGDVDSNKPLTREQAGLLSSIYIFTRLPTLVLASFAASTGALFRRGTALNDTSDYY